MIPARRFAFALLATLACRPTETLRLPEAPEAELAFAILYDDLDRAVRFGDVVPRQRVYAGRYSIFAEDSDLRSRLYFVGTQDLLAAARARCDEQMLATDRIRCRTAVEACEDAPSTCLTARPRGESCGERMTLPAAMPILAFESTSDGRMLPYAGEDTPPVGATLCGPIISPSCTNYVAGFAATVDGEFACVVDVAQRGCVAELDGTRCGLPPVAVEVADDGALVDAAGTCTFARAADEFDMRCGELTVRLTALEQTLGRAPCRRAGPAVYNTLEPRSGRITGGLVYAPPGWEPRQVLVGRGVDHCARAGCDFLGGSCNNLCTDSCARSFELNECASDSWDPCVGVSQLDACLERCLMWCARDSWDVCYFDVDGDSLTIARHDLPERELLRVDVDTPSNVGTTGRQALAVLDNQWIVAATSNHLSVLAPTNVDELTVVTSSTVDFAVGAVLATGRDLYVFGRSGTRGAMSLRRVFDDRIDLVATATAIDELPIIDAAAFGGASLERIHIASIEGRATAVGSVARADVRGAITMVDVGAPVTALIALPGGAVLAGTEAGLVILDGAQVRARIDVWSGLRATALSLDPTTCGEGTDACHVYVGLEQTARAEEAHVGVMVYRPAAPDSSVLANVLTPLRTPQVGVILPDPVHRVITAIAPARNTMSIVALP